MTSLRERLDQIANSVTGGDLIDGASLYQQSVARVRRRRGLLVSVAAAAVVATIVVVASLVDPGGSPRYGPASPPASAEPSESSEMKDTCPVGEERAVYRNAPKGELTSVLLGCAQLHDGRKVELLNMPGGCLQIVGIDNWVRECGNAPSEQEPPQTARAVAAQMIAQRNAAASLEVYGATSPEVRAVELRYTRGGSSHSTRAELIRVIDSEALEEARIGEPFGYFLAELPPKTSTVRAIALDADGQMLGEDDFEPFLRSQPRTAPISGPSR